MAGTGATPLSRTIAPHTAMAADNGGGPGQALRQVGNTLSQVADTYVAVQTQSELTNAQLTATKKINELSSQFDQNMGDPATAASRFADAAAKIKDDVAAGLNFPGARLAFDRNFGQLAEAHTAEIRHAGMQRLKETSIANATNAADYLSKQAAYAKNPVERASYVKQADENFQGLVTTGAVSPVVAARMRMGFDNNLARYDAGALIDRDPQGAVKQLANPDYLPALSPLERQNFAEQAQQKILAAERERRAALRDTRMDAREAVSDLSDIIRNGLPVSREALDNATHLVRAAQDKPVADRFLRVMQMSNIMTGLRGASPREAGAAQLELERQAAQKGAGPNLSMAIGALRTFRSQQDSALRSDPLTYAQQQGRAQLDPLSLTGQDSAAAWKGRILQADKVADWYGIKPQYLTKAESENVAAMLSPDQPAKVRLATAQMLISGLGSKAKSVFADLAKNDPVIGQAGVLLLDGNRKAATDALNGQSLLKSSADGKQSDLRPSPQKRAMLSDPASLRLSQAVGLLMPGMRGRVLSTADAIYAARAPSHGWTGADVGTNTDAGRAYNRAVQEATGASFDDRGNQYGGLGEYRGSPVIVPRGINADQFEDAVQGLSQKALTTHSVTGQPPVVGGKTVTPRDLRHLYVVTAGDGIYALSTTDPKSGATIVHDAGGTPYRFSVTEAFDHPGAAK